MDLKSKNKITTVVKKEITIEGIVDIFINFIQHLLDYNHLCFTSLMYNLFSLCINYMINFEIKNNLTDLDSLMLLMNIFCIINGIKIGSIILFILIKCLFSGYIIAINKYFINKNFCRKYIFYVYCSDLSNYYYDEYLKPNYVFEDNNINNINDIRNKYGNELSETEKRVYLLMQRFCIFNEVIVFIEIIIFLISNYYFGQQLNSDSNNPSPGKINSILAFIIGLSFLIALIIWLIINVVYYIILYVILPGSCILLSICGIYYIYNHIKDVKITYLETKVQEV